MSESAVVPFKFESHEVRTVEISGEPWFVAKDVCEVLEIKTEQTRRLEDDEKGLRSLQTLGGMQEMTIISESGLYALIVRSNKPQAKVFRKWVTSEVLPAIRKTGQYVAPQQPKHGQLALVQQDWQAAVEMAKIAGLTGNQAVLAADKLMRNMTGVSPLAQLETLHLICETQERNLTPTEIASFKEVSDVARVVFCIEKDKKATAQHINILIERMGFQTSRYVDKQKVWSMTEKGKPFATLVDANGAHGKKTPIQQLKWKESVVKEIVKYFANK